MNEQTAEVSKEEVDIIREAVEILDYEVSFKEAVMDYSVNFKEAVMDYEVNFKEAVMYIKMEATAGR